MDRRVFWSVLCALLVFSGLVFFGFSVLVAGQRFAVAQAQAQADKREHDLEQQVVQAEVERRQRQEDDQWLRERSLLQPNQRCVGGVVVQVQGSTYVQIGYPGHPAHCDGQYADQPLR